MAGPNDYYLDGSWNARCSMCGGKFKANELTKNWQGMYRCARCQEPRQPQDFVRAVPDIQTPPWVQPTNVAYAAFCTANGSSAVPDYGMPDCMIPDYLSPSFNSDGDPFDG